MPKILLIEDDVTFSAMLERFLKKNGFAVDTSYSSEEAQKKMAENVYDLIFTDPSRLMIPVKIYFSSKL